MLLLLLGHLAHSLKHTEAIERNILSHTMFVLSIEKDKKKSAVLKRDDLGNYFYLISQFKNKSCVNQIVFFIKSCPRKTLIHVKKQFFC